MLERRVTAGPDRVAHVIFTDRGDGDLCVDQPAAGLARAQRSIADGPWSWLRQVHGSGVVVVGEPGAGAGAEADASVTSAPGAVLAVQTADCAPIILVCDGAVGIVHAGWRGLVAGVVPAAVTALRRIGSGEVRALIGPLIRPGHYEFGEPELSAVVAEVGQGARGTTHDGRPALDVAAAATLSLEAAGVSRVDDLGLDTACPRYFSSRCRGEAERQSTVVWMEQS